MPMNYSNIFDCRENMKLSLVSFYKGCFLAQEKLSKTKLSYRNEFSICFTLSIFHIESVPGSLLFSMLRDNTSIFFRLKVILRNYLLCEGISAILYICFLKFPCLDHVFKIQPPKHTKVYFFFISFGA